jgi:hypothetical protein
MRMRVRPGRMPIYPNAPLPRSTCETCAFPRSVTGRKCRVPSSARLWLPALSRFAKGGNATFFFPFRSRLSPSYLPRLPATLPLMPRKTLASLGYRLRYQGVGILAKQP